MTTDTPYAQPDLNPRPNTPPADELASVRWQIHELEAREAELKAMLLANPDIREGANWIAEVLTVNTTYTDLKELRAMHKDLVDEYTFPKRVTRVVLSAIDADTGELISAKRARQAAAS